MLVLNRQLLGSCYTLDMDEITKSDGNEVIKKGIGAAFVVGAVAGLGYMLWSRSKNEKGKDKLKKVVKNQVKQATDQIPGIVERLMDEVLPESNGKISVSKKVKSKSARKKNAVEAEVVE